METKLVNSRREINKVIVYSKHFNQLGIVDGYGLHHPKMAEFTFSSSSVGKFINVDGFLGHKICPNKFEKIEIIQCTCKL